MSSEVMKYIPPVGSIIFMESDLNPAEVYPNTVWQIMENNVYFTIEKEQMFSHTGKPLLPYNKPRSWKRLK